MNLTGHGILDDNEAEFIDRDLGSNIVYNKTSNYTVKRMHHASFQKEILIPPYIAIFLLAVVGNLLVILTLVQNKRMRTVTNVFLLNLSISDLLLAVFCMPFTLIPVLLRNFIFGATMCVLIRYLQGVSVAVSCFTLVAMSLERYFGICQPLHSRRWQTLSRAYKIITGCWFLAAMVVIPIAIVTRMKSFDKGKTHVCREFWTSKIAEKCYTVFLDMAFLLIPVIIMSGSYGSIMWTLWMGIKMDKKMQDGENQRNQPGNSMRMCVFEGSPSRNSENRPIVTPKRRRYDLQSGVRQSNLDRNVAAKKRVIKMLAVVVLEFFVCWTPLFFAQTWLAFDARTAHSHISPVGLAFIHLLSYVSSCCNPITYCFMNRKFRESFLGAFCCRRRRSQAPDIAQSTSQIRQGESIATVNASLNSIRIQFEPPLKHLQEMKPNFSNITESDDTSDS
ncbi:cholecystokinin receptor type A-like [Octopus vulgaris]|uniref:Cholecystokinin receptor type A-like n=2 Tax=Octopus TaxID=6643 RepID=A0AA36B674_OCTVU|nr:cholecystokinin receptor type A-like [Octopus vulgaris]